MDLGKTSVTNFKLLNLQAQAPGQSQIGVYRSQGETNVSGNHKFEAMDMGQTSVTSFKLLNL